MTRDYAFIYAKLARHVVAAEAHLAHGFNGAIQARMELEEAMQAIAAFETTAATIHAVLDPQQSHD